MERRSRRTSDLAQAGGRLLVQPEPAGCPAEGLCRGPRPIRRQVERRQLPGQLAQPPRPARLVRRGRGLGRGRRGKRGRLRAQLPGQHGERPEIGDDVMQDEAEDALARRAGQQPHPHQRPLLQIERPVRLRGEPLPQRRLARAGCVFYKEIDRGGAAHQPPGLAAARREHGPQRAMAVHQGLERAPQRLAVLPPLQTRRERDVVGRALRSQAVEEPERPLAVGQRMLPRCFGPGRSGGDRPSPASDELGRQTLDRAAAQQAPERRLRPELALDAVPDLERRDRIQPQLAQRPIGRNLPRIEAQHLPDQRRQHARERRFLVLRERGHFRLLSRLQDAPPEDAQPLFEIERAAGPVLDLAARRAGHRGRRHEDHVVDADLVLLGHGPADRRRHLLHLPDRRPLDLVDDHEPLLAPDLHRKRRAAPGTEAGMAGFRRGLDVLGIVVPPVEDDQVLEPSGDEELAVADESQIAGAQKRAFAGARQSRREVARRRFRGAPVAGRHVLAGHPDLPHRAQAAGRQRLRVHDQDAAVHPGPAAPDQVARGAVRGGLAHRMALQSLRLDREHPRPRRALRAGDEQRRLGQAIAGEERLRAEPTGRERRCETLQ